MLRYLFSIYDSKAKSFVPPFCMPSAALAIRWFRWAVNESPESDLFKFSEDYTLFCLAAFDEETGKFDVYDAPESLITGVAAKTRE